MEDCTDDGGVNVNATSVFIVVPDRLMGVIPSKIMPVKASDMRSESEYHVCSALVWRSSKL